MSEWQPIEAAPHEGDILLWNGHRIDVGFLWEEDGMFFSVGDALDQPTHWMPLPDAPTKDSQ